MTPYLVPLAILATGILLAFILGACRCASRCASRADESSDQLARQLADGARGGVGSLHGHASISGQERNHG